MERSKKEKKDNKHLKVQKVWNAPNTRNPQVTAVNRTRAEAVLSHVI